MCTPSDADYERTDFASKFPCSMSTRAFGRLGKEQRTFKMFVFDNLDSGWTSVPGTLRCLVNGSIALEGSRVVVGHDECSAN